MADAVVSADRPAWLAERRRRLGSSDVAAVLAIPGAYGTAWQVWADKVLGVERPRSRRMLRGLFLEPWLADSYREHTGVELAPDGRLHVHPDHSWAAATPDFRHADDPGTIVETKAASRWAWRDGVPAHLEAQAHWQLAVTGADRVIFAVDFLDGDGFVPDGRGDVPNWTIARDEPLESRMLDLAGEWWQRHIVERVEPPVDGSDGTAAGLADRWPRDVDDYLLAPELAPLLRRFADARADEKAAKGRKDEAGNELRQAIGAHAGVTLPGDPKPAATWLAQTSRRLNQRAALAALIDAGVDVAPLFELCSTRVLRVNYQTEESF